MIEKEMNELKKSIVGYSSFVLRMVEDSIKALTEKDEMLLKKVIGEYEDKANLLEIEIDEQSIELIAKYQPKAKNLRTTLMIMRMNNDLERAADEAVNMAEGALYVIARPEVKKLIDIPRMADIAMSMLKDGMDSFINEDAVLARSVCRRDEDVDSLRDQVIRELITYMISDSGTIERSLNLMRIARAIERIGDLATNFGEDVVFMVTGKIIKHHQDEK